VFEKKKLAKRRAEEEKETRKRKRIEAKGGKGKLVPAVTTVKQNYSIKVELILLAPVVIKLSNLNLAEVYVAMIVTMPSMKNVFQNNIRSTFQFLKMSRVLQSETV